MKEDKNWFDEISDKCKSLEKERDELKASKAFWARWNKSDLETIKKLHKELQTLKDGMREYEEQSRHGWETEEAHDESLDKLKELIK